MNQLRRVGKFLPFAVTVSYIGRIGHKVYEDGRIEANNFPEIRSGRTAYAVERVVFDYGCTLYSTSYDSPEEYEKEKKKAHVRSAQRMLKLCEQNGGCFIKVGQHIATLKNLLPEEYVNEFKVLHSNAPKMDMEDIRAVIREEFGADPDEIFDDFDEEPLGTASLAQVHKAKLKKTGEEVAVKVQHRCVQQHFDGDIQTMHFLVRVVNWVFPTFEFMWLAEEMEKNLPLELDFREEGKNAEKVSKMYANYEWLKVPKIYWEFTSKRILVMEYCSGSHITDKEYIEQNGIDKTLLSKRVGEMYGDMTFRHGFLHCDPHPGNILVRKNMDGKDEIVLLDHGLYKQLTDEFRLQNAHLFDSILKGDQEAIQNNAEKLGVGQHWQLLACMLTERSWDSIQKGIDKSEKNDAEVCFSLSLLIVSS